MLRPADNATVKVLFATLLDNDSEVPELREKFSPASARQEVQEVQEEVQEEVREISKWS